MYSVQHCHGCTLVFEDVFCPALTCFVCTCFAPGRLHVSLYPPRKTHLDQGELFEYGLSDQYVPGLVLGDATRKACAIPFPYTSFSHTFSGTIPWCAMWTYTPILGGAARPLRPVECLCRRVRPASPPSVLGSLLR